LADSPPLPKEMDGDTDSGVEPMNSEDMHSSFVQWCRLGVFLLWSLAYVPFYTLVLALRGPYRAMARLYWRVVCKILGIRLRRHGEICTAQPVLYVANHASYLDILALGALIQGVFVAKQEVGTWPGISILARLGRTIFVERRSVRAAEQSDVIGAHLATGERLIIFPEGTSNSGNRIQPFKSSLFSVAERYGASAQTGENLPVQPITIAYTRLDDLPIGRAWRAFFAWYGDMDLAPHLLWLLGLGRLTIDIVFHPPVTIADFPSRKALSAHCQTVIANGLAEANAGRLPTQIASPVGKALP